MREWKKILSMAIIAAGASAMSFCMDVKVKAADEVVFRSVDGYAFHHNVGGDFDTAVDMYGIYDENKEKWVVPLQNLPNLQGKEDTIKYCGEGIFSYTVNNEENGDLRTVFVSGDAEGYFVTDILMDNDTDCYFEGGYAIGLASGQKKDEYEIYVISSKGEQEPTGIFTKDKIIDERFRNRYGFVIDRGEESYPDDWLTVYFYSNKNQMGIDNRYASKITDGEWRTEFNIVWDRLIITNLLGADRERYFVVLDNQGEPVSEAAKMESFNYWDAVGVKALLRTALYVKAIDREKGIALVYNRTINDYYSCFLIDIKGKVLAQFEEIGMFDSEEGWIDVKQDGKWGVANTEGKIICAAVWDSIQLYTEGLAIVEKDGKYGYLNYDGEAIAPVDLDEALEFHEGVAMVKRWGHPRCINNIGKTILMPIEWDSVGRVFSHGLLLVGKDEKYGYINIRGEVVVPVEWDNADTFGKDGLAKVEKDGKYGCINTRGEVVVAAEWDDLTMLGGRCVEAKKEGKTTYMRVSEEGVKTLLEWDSINHFRSREEYTRVKKDEKYGYINTAGELVVPAEWDYADVYISGGRAIVEKNGKCGVINMMGEIVTPIEWDSASISLVPAGWCLVKKENEYMCVNPEGDIAFAYGASEPYIEVVDENHAFVKKGGLWYLIDKDSNVII